MIHPEINKEYLVKVGIGDEWRRMTCLGFGVFIDGDGQKYTDTEVAGWMDNEPVCNCGLPFSEHNVRHPFIDRDKEPNVISLNPVIEKLKGLQRYNEVKNLMEGYSTIVYSSRGDYVKWSDIEKIIKENE